MEMSSTELAQNLTQVHYYHGVHDVHGVNPKASWPTNPLFVWRLAMF